MSDTQVIENKQAFVPHSGGSIATYVSGASSSGPQSSPTDGGGGAPIQNTLGDGTPNTVVDPAPKQPPVSAPVTFEATGNPTIDAGVAVLAQQGLTNELVTSALSAAIASGDVSDIDTKMINEKLGPVFGPYAVQLASQYVQHVADANKAVVNEVYAAVGGEAAWGQLRDRFKVIADQSMTGVVEALINSGKAVDAARFMQSIVNTSGKVPVNTQAITAGTPKVDDALDKSTFLSLYDELSDKAKKEGCTLGSPKYVAQADDLFRRRKLGMARGL